MDTKMDWMYKGNQTVNREEYLLGRPVDKAFEQMQQAEKETEQNRVPKNHVEYECIPPSLRFFSGNEQVDLARKMQEDPLYAIKKKEIETRNQLLKNPVKLKQIRELLEQQSKKSKHKKKKKKSKEISSEDEDKLDMLLATKYNQLKNNVTEKDLLKSIKRIRHKQKKKSKKRSRSSESESDSSDNDDRAKEERHKRRKKQRKSMTDSDNSDSDSSNKSSAKTKKKTNEKKLNERAEKIDDNKKGDRRRQSSKNRDTEKKRSKRYREEKYNGRYRQRYRNNSYKDDRMNRYNNRRYFKKRSDRTISDRERTLDAKSSNTDDVKFKEARKEEKYKSKTKLTEEDRKKRLRDMMENAVWRDKEREKNIKLYREAEQKEAEDSKLYNKDFIRKQLVVATEMSTVASRIKSNINNIQRSGRAMDTNFAKR